MLAGRARVCVRHRRRYRPITQCYPVYLNNNNINFFFFNKSQDNLNTPPYVCMRSIHNVRYGSRRDATMLLFISYLACFVAGFLLLIAACTCRKPKNYPPGNKPDDCIRAVAGIASRRHVFRRTSVTPCPNRRRSVLLPTIQRRVHVCFVNN